MTDSKLADYLALGSTAAVIIGVLIYSTHPMIVFAAVFFGSFAILLFSDLGFLFLFSGFGPWIAATSLIGMGICYLFGFP